MANQTEYWYCSCKEEGQIVPVGYILVFEANDIPDWMKPVKVVEDNIFFAMWIEQRRLTRVGE